MRSDILSFSAVVAASLVASSDLVSASSNIELENEGIVNVGSLRKLKKGKKGEEGGKKIAKKAKKAKKGTTSDSMAFSTVGPPDGENVCHEKKVEIANVQCVIDQVNQTGEQSGTNVTEGYKGNQATTAVPITVPYYQKGLCPVNVHWHLGTEHLSAGEYDETGTGPTEIAHRRKLAGKARQGFQCNLYDDSEDMFTSHYDWKYCTDMEVGQTYEVHWPHSTIGACGTVNQFQTPFYDGVFCYSELLTADTVINENVGVQAQVFTIVNDEDYYYPDLMRGMIVDGDFGADVAKYTGSTTGTSRNNEICSGYTPITWQVDRKCHLVSASTFDKMCADMLSQRDDMSTDVYPHGSRELVADHLAANNLNL